MRKFTLKPIGRVENGNTIDMSPDEMQPTVSRIIVDKKYGEGLMGLDKNDLITVLFYFDRARGYKMRLHPRHDESRPVTGVFNTRSQYRPNHIGVTAVRLKSIEGNTLVVEGLDAADGTPVLDIKPHVLTFDEGKKVDDPRKDRTYKADR
jgi:tRNA-Thr(GGU) m(6)t(6)A37 methyltransferase TsaA